MKQHQLALGKLAQATGGTHAALRVTGEKEGESTAEMLRRVVRVMDTCRESTWDGIPIAEIVQVIESCWRSGWDVYPDQYTPQQWNAAKWGQAEKLAAMLAKDGRFS